MLLRSPLAGLPDATLLRRFEREGDELAFAEIVRRYADHVYSVCLRVLGDAALAEDATQETFFKLMRQPRTVRHSLGGWLHRAATHQSIDRARQDTARRRREQHYARQHPAASHDAELTWDTVAPQVDEALNALPNDARELLIAHFLHDRTLSDLAEQQGLSKATLSRRCQEALALLRHELRRRGVVGAAAALGTALAAHSVHAAPPATVMQLRTMAMASGSFHPGAAAGHSIFISHKALAAGVGWLLVAAMAVLFILLSLRPGSQAEAHPRETPPPVSSELVHAR